MKINVAPVLLVEIHDAGGSTIITDFLRFCSQRKIYTSVRAGTSSSWFYTAFFDMKDQEAISQFFAEYCAARGEEAGDSE